MASSCETRRRSRHSQLLGESGFKTLGDAEAASLIANTRLRHCETTTPAGCGTPRLRREHPPRLRGAAKSRRCELLRDAGVVRDFGVVCQTLSSLAGDAVLAQESETRNPHMRKVFLLLMLGSGLQRGLPVGRRFDTHYHRRVQTDARAPLRAIRRVLGRTDNVKRAKLLPETFQVPELPDGYVPRAAIEARLEARVSETPKEYLIIEGPRGTGKSALVRKCSPVAAMSSTSSSRPNSRAFMRL